MCCAFIVSSTTSPSPNVSSLGCPATGIWSCAVSSGVSNLQAALAHRVQVGAAGDEHDVVAVLEELRADGAADGAAPVDDVPHQTLRLQAVASVWP